MWTYVGGAKDGVSETVLHGGGAKQVGIDEQCNRTVQEETGTDKMLYMTPYMVIQSNLDIMITGITKFTI